MCDEEPGCGCTGVCVACLAVEELALASLEVEGAEPESPVRTPEVALP